MKKDIFQKRMEEIAMKTLRMNDVFALVMGGPNKEESREILRKLGWSEKKIKKLEE